MFSKSPLLLLSLSPHGLVASNCCSHNTRKPWVNALPWGRDVLVSMGEALLTQTEMLLPSLLEASPKGC